MAEEKAIKLTEKQRKFCLEYIFDYNASRAAREAGYSEDTAGAIGWENLKKPEIKAYIKELQNNLEETSGISRLKVLREHEKLAFSSIAHLHNTWITRKEFEELTEEQKASIESIETSIKRIVNDFEAFDVEYVKVKLYSKQKSLDSISKLLGFDAPQKIAIQTTSEVIKLADGTEIEI